MKTFRFGCPVKMEWHHELSLLKLKQEHTEEGELDLKQKAETSLAAGASDGSSRVESCQYSDCGNKIVFLFESVCAFCLYEARGQKMTKMTQTINFST